MSDVPTFTEILVSKLGTPKEPFGLDDVLFLSLIFAAAAAYFALEYGAARLISRFFQAVRASYHRAQEPPREE